MKIGFIGLGIMGKPMVRNIMKAGYTEVLVWNRSKAPMDEVVADGAIASTPKQIGESCDVVITMGAGDIFRAGEALLAGE